MTEKMTLIENITGGVSLVGALNWGLIGFFNFDLVQNVLPGTASLVYKIVGISAVYFIYRLYKRFWRK